MPSVFDFFVKVFEDVTGRLVRWLLYIALEVAFLMLALYMLFEMMIGKKGSES